MSGFGVQAKDVSASTFESDVIDRSRELPVIVDFWAPWCGPCTALTPMLEQAVAAWEGRVELVKLNVDEAPDLAQAFGIQGIPAVKAFRDGQVVSEFVGVQPSDVIETWIRSLLPSEAEQVLSRAREAAGTGHEGDALAILRERVETQPRDMAARLELGRMLAVHGEFEGAREVLSGIEAGAAEEEDGQRELLLVEMMLAAEAPAETDGPCDRLFAEAGAAWRENRPGDTIGRLLELVKTDRSYRDDGARRALLAVFDHLGPEHPEVQAGRRSLANLLF